MFFTLYYFLNSFFYIFIVNLILHCKALKNIFLILALYKSIIIIIIITIIVIIIICLLLLWIPFPLPSNGEDAKTRTYNVLGGCPKELRETDERHEKDTLLSLSTNN